MSSNELAVSMVLATVVGAERILSFCEKRAEELLASGLICGGAAAVWGAFLLSPDNPAVSTPLLLGGLLGLAWGTWGVALMLLKFWD